MIFLKMLTVLTLSYFASGFVMLGNTEPKLEGIPSQIDGVPEVTFVWDGSTPSEISNLEKYPDLVGLDTELAMEAIILKSMAIWNDIPGNGIRLKLEKGRASLLTSDLQNSIISAKNPNLSSAAFAVPYYPRDEPYMGKVIIDCDISINDTAVDAASLIKNTTHELGHCLGLGHSHNNYKTLMGYSRDDNSADLGADDMAGILYLYSSDSEKPKEEISCGVVKGVTDDALLFLIILIFPSLIALESNIRSFLVKR